MPEVIEKSQGLENHLQVAESGFPRQAEDWQAVPRALHELHRLQLTAQSQKRLDA